MAPSRVRDHTWSQSVSKAFTASVSVAPAKNEPVPTAMPVAPPARKGPTAGDESTVWVVGASQMIPPFWLRMRRWPPCW